MVLEVRVPPPLVSLMLYLDRLANLSTGTGGCLLSGSSFSRRAVVVETNRIQLFLQQMCSLRTNKYLASGSGQVGNVSNVTASAWLVS